MDRFWEDVELLAEGTESGVFQTLQFILGEEGTAIEAKYVTE